LFSIGIVSATDRSVRSLTQFQIEGAIQTDASINPGNSGGPLLDASARVIGINQQIETSSGANDGVGFAVPISVVQRSLAQLKQDGTVEYAYIGVSSQALYPQLAKKLGLDTDFGGLLAEVVPGGPADQAGLEGGEEKLRFQAGAYRTGGDVIISVEGRKVVRPDDLARFIAALKPGDEVTLEVLHEGERETIEVTLGERPSGEEGG
jgi:putative serine protease PepD